MSSKLNSDEPASSHMSWSEWHHIEWSIIYRTVRGIQVRIAKAARKGQSRKVKNLQRMLTRSFAARALAVRRVTENRGKKTPGVDGEIWSLPDLKWQAISRLGAQRILSETTPSCLYPKS